MLTLWNKFLHRMPSSAIRPSQDKRAIVLDVLRTRGFDVREFEIEEDPSSEVLHMFGLNGSLLTVRCAKTGEERLYATSANSPWLSVLITDLEKGCFKRVAQRC